MRLCTGRFLWSTVLVLGSACSQIAMAQFANVHNFPATVSSTNTDGAVPVSGLIPVGPLLYGTTTVGGTWGNGTVFKIDRCGSSFATLYDFGPTGSKPFVNADGAHPESALVYSNGILYGTAGFGGRFGSGTVFIIRSDGTGFSALHHFGAATNSVFTNSDGAFPKGLILSGNTLYGVTYEGGKSGKGTVFRINTDGSSFTNLHSFLGDDGSTPLAAPLLSAGRLYGTTGSGGTSGQGTVFSISLDGSDFRTLHSFGPLDPNLHSNADGAVPMGSLVLSGKTLYGTACYGGIAGCGTVFMVDTDGSNFVTLHSFAAMDLSTGINNEGAFPTIGLVLSGHRLYGAAQYGGNSGNGSLFSLNVDGTGFSKLSSFLAIEPSTGTNSTGAFPFGQLVLADNTLYGTAKYGGHSGLGAVFSYSLPQLTLSVSDAGVVLTWPTNVPAAVLQSSSTPVSTANWVPVAASPVVIDANYVLTNSIESRERFFRLH